MEGHETESAGAGASSAISDWIPTSTWIQSAKEKTLSTLESVKKDLNEFTDTVQHEATSLANATVSSVKQQAELIQKFVSDPHSVFPDEHTSEQPADKVEAVIDDRGVASDTTLLEANASESKSYFNTGSVGDWMQSIVHSVQKIGGIEDTTKDEDSYTQEIRGGSRESKGARMTVLDQCTLLQIQNSENTYVDAPAQDLDLYREWLKDFKISEHNGEINMLLGYNPRLREIYSRLVPSKVNNLTFWSRYFFKVHIRELDKEISTEAHRSVRQSGTKSPEEASKSEPATERDETWSMCSGANSTSSNTDPLQEVNDEDDETDASRQGAATPRQVADIQDDEQALSGDEWEKCEPK